MTQFGWKRLYFLGVSNSILPNGSPSISQHCPTLPTLFHNTHYTLVHSNYTFYTLLHFVMTKCYTFTMLFLQTLTYTLCYTLYIFTKLTTLDYNLLRFLATVTVCLLYHGIFLFSFLRRTHLLFGMFSYNWVHSLILLSPLNSSFIKL